MAVPSCRFFVPPKENKASSSCRGSWRAGGALGLLVLLGGALWPGVGPARAAEQPVSEIPSLATVVDFHVAIRDHPSQRYRYSWDLDVCYYDPGWKLMWIEDQGQAEYLPIKDAPVAVHAGQRVRFEGEVVPAEGLSLKAARLTVLPGAVAIQPLDARGAIADKARWQNHLVTLEATVDTQSEPDSTHLQLSGHADEHRVIITILIDPKAPRPSLEGALVSVDGVYTRQDDTAAQPASIGLWVARLDNLKVLTPEFPAPTGFLHPEAPGKPGSAEEKSSGIVRSAAEGGDAFLSDLGRFYVMESDNPTRRYRYSWDLDVLYYDPDWKLMWVENNGKPDFIPPGDVPLPIKAGQRARFEGEIVPAQGLSLKGARLTLLPPHSNIRPLETRGVVADNGRFHNRFVSLEAIVDRQSEPDSRHLLLEASAEEHHVVMRVLVDPQEPRPQLEGALVSATGIYSGVTNFSGQLTSISLWVPRLGNLKVRNWLAQDPRFDQPGIAIDEIPRQPNGTPVKVVGTVHSFDSANSTLMLRDATGQVQVSTAQTNQIGPGVELEAIGNCESSGVLWRLRNAIVRIRPKTGASSDEQPPGLTTTLRLADQVLALKPDEANQGIPVQIFGVATWADPAGNSIFVQDVSRGVEVRIPPGQKRPSALPYSVSIKGRTAQGPFAPMVISSEVLWHDPLGAPEARSVTLEQLMTGGEHGRWVEVYGYLRNVSHAAGATRLDLTASTGEFTAELPPDADVSALQGAILGVQGVCNVVADSRRKLVAVKLLVPSASFIRLVKAAPKDPFAVEESSVASLREFTPVNSFLRRIRTSGTVLLHSPGRFIALQQGAEALLVLCRQRVKLAPGDRIEVVGIPGREGPRLVLREASCRRIQEGNQPAPLVLSGPPIYDGAIDGHLVSLDATIVSIQQRTQETSFTLQSGNRLFEATLATPPSPESPAQIGSLVAVTGVYRTKYDEYLQPIDFTILLRSEADLNVLQSPPLWTVGKALSVAGVLLVLVVAGVSWVVVLRLRVQRQTILIREQFESQARLEGELQRAARIESLGFLAGGIAHDFNNLLTVILGNISLALAESKVVEAAGDVLEDAKLGAQRARDLTQKLLTFSKGGDPFRTAVQLADLARETLIFALHGSNVRSDMSVPPDLWDIDADRTQIGQVIQNLMINAIQAMPTGGLIRVVLENTVVSENAMGGLTAGKYVRLTVADTGAGIAPELLSKVFDPYFTTKTLGSGLGLATAYSIVKKHLGHIEVQSSIGVGTTFQVWLPAAKDRSPAPAPAKVIPAPAASSHPQSARILLMDDEAVIRLLCGKAFSRVGFELTTAASGVEAVQEFSRARAGGRPYQLVIFDLTVPGGMGGKDALTEIRKIDPDIRAIASSGYSNDPVMADPRRFGFDAIVPKPYEIDQMIDTVRHLLAQKV